MKIIPFPKPALWICPPHDRAPIGRDSGLDDIFWHLETIPATLLMFVDETPYCQDYLNANPWIGTIASVVVLDSEIMDFFRIDLIPCWIWFQNGVERSRAYGHPNQAEINRCSESLIEPGTL